MTNRLSRRMLTGPLEHLLLPHHITARVVSETCICKGCQGPVFKGQSIPLSKISPTSNFHYGLRPEFQRHFVGETEDA